MAKTSLTVDTADLTGRSTREPFAGSHKVYLKGERADICVPFRDIKALEFHQHGSEIYR